MFLHSSVFVQGIHATTQDWASIRAILSSLNGKRLFVKPHARFHAVWNKNLCACGMRLKLFVRSRDLSILKWKVARDKVFVREDVGRCIVVLQDERTSSLRITFL